MLTNIFFLLGFVEPTNQMQLFCRNQQIGVLFENDIHLTSELMILCLNAPDWL